MPDLDVSQWISIVGWPITFVLGISATLIAQKLGRSRKRISWTVANESDLLSREVLDDLSSGFEVPIQILVNNIPQAALSTVRVKLVNTGNSEVEDITLHFRFGDSASVHVGRYLGNLGSYRDALHLEKDGNSARLNVDHMNQKQAIEVEFLVGNYNPGDFVVDLAKTGVELRRTDIATIEAGASLGASIGLGIMGVRYDPVATQTALLVQEIRKLRLNSKSQTPKTQD